MTTAREMINLANTAQALNLVGANVSYAKKKKKSVGGILGLGVGNIVGASMIKTTADIGSTI